MIQEWQARYSENIRSYGGYSIGKTLKYLKDPEIISLAGGLPSPDMFLTDEVRSISDRMLSQDIDRILQYSGVPGEASLIEAVIQFLDRDNIHVSENQVLVTTSGQHGLDLTGRLFLDPGDSLILDRPTFAGAIVAFQMQRPRFVGVDITSDGSDVPDIRAKVEAHASAGHPPKFIYVVPDFQNPTGITMSLDKRRALLDLSYDTGIPIVEDSPYRDLRYYGETIPSIFSLDQERDGGHVIGLYTFSKLFCPGLRVGFNIGPPEVIEKMTNIKEGNILNTPKYNQDLCAAFLTEMHLDSHLAKCRAYYGAKLDVFLDTMAAHFPPDTGVTWTRPEGGLFLWVTVPKQINTMDLFYEAIKYKVAFIPGDVFYGENPSTNHMRINFSYASKEQLVEAVERLAACIKEKIQ